MMQSRERLQSVNGKRGDGAADIGLGDAFKESRDDVVKNSLHESWNRKQKMRQSESGL